MLQLAGIDYIDDAQTLGGLDVIVPVAERLELEDDAEYISDLIDCVVYAGGQAIGQVSAVDFPTTADGSRRLAGLPEVANALKSIYSNTICRLIARLTSAKTPVLCHSVLYPVLLMYSECGSN